MTATATTAATTVRPLPALRPNRRLKVPKQAERTLGNGLTVIAVRRSSVPLVELRLWMPFGRTRWPQRRPFCSRLVR